VAIAIGANIAAVAMLPGPSEAMVQASVKNITGMSAVLPRQSFTAACATLPERAVDLRLCEEQRDAGEVRNSCTGKPATTSSSRIPPA
jgi:hypothetical protein